MIHCSLLLGAPQSADGSDNNVLIPSKVFEQSVYSCACTDQASIQRLNITMNQQTTYHTTYSDLQISRQSTNTPILWAIESTAMKVNQDNPYWGPVSDDFANDAHLYTQKSEALILPVGNSDFPFTSNGIATFDLSDIQGSSLPGLIFTLMENLWLTQSESTIREFDFTGKNDYGVLTLWQEVSKTVDTAPQIVKSIWTNLMANNAMGTGNFSNTDVSPHGIGVIYDIPYAIPALITLIYWISFICFGLFLLLRRQVNLNQMRNAINQRAIGRVVVNMVNPSADSLGRTKEWVSFERKGKIGLVFNPSAEGEDTSRINYDPRDQLLFKALNSIPQPIPLPTPSRSQLRARPSSAFKFVPLKESDDSVLEYFKPHDENSKSINLMNCNYFIIYLIIV
ncbi:hypothetical protein BGW37DRAFT_261820 [Umbelopsis sp. PMI_123]|nr:hypothetical protein BGW37DRAFT_261820 [Umbelopsis sp. PMI_123]